MNENICIFGHDIAEFPTANDFVGYLVEGIFLDCAARYRRGLPPRDVTSILLCYDGAIYGRFDVSRREPATVADKSRFAPSEWVYRVVRSARYERPVPVAEVGLTRINFCPTVSRADFNDIERRAGQITYFHPPI